MPPPVNFLLSREVGMNELNCILRVNKDAQIQAFMDMKDLVTNMKYGNDPDRKT